MPEPLQPPLHPATNEPVGPDDLAPLFPMGLIAQEVSTEPWIDVPGRGPRHPPAVAADAARARRAARARARHARRASTSRTSRCRPPVRTSRTPRSPQAFYNKAEGVARLSTETGAGQWGTALVVRVRAVRPRVQGVHGAGVVRAEAVPEDPDGDVGRARSCRHPSTNPIIPARSASRSATRFVTRRPATTRTTPSARSSTTCCCTRR